MPVFWKLWKCKIVLWSLNLNRAATCLIYDLWIGFYAATDMITYPYIPMYILLWNTVILLYILLLLYLNSNNNNARNNHNNKKRVFFFVVALNQKTTRVNYYKGFSEWAISKPDRLVGRLYTKMTIERKYKYYFYFFIYFTNEKSECSFATSFNCIHIIVSVINHQWMYFFYYLKELFACMFVACL